MKPNNKKKSQSSFSHKKPQPAAEKATIEEITSQDTKGRVFTLSGTIDRVVQTGGPTVFYITDGTGTLPIKGFEGAGVRAYPEVEEGDSITTKIRVEEFRDELEGEILSLEKLEGEKKEEFVKYLAEIERKRAEVEPPEFLVKSPTLDKLKDRFIKAATEIRLAIIQNRPIIVRHHNDADGYSSGFALEKAIIPLIVKQHGSGGKAPWEYYTRSPCQAPFYEIDDSIRDTAHSLSDEAKFSNKMPLVIIADNGSSQEDLMGIQQGKIHGMDFIVIDHHVFEEDVISKEVLVHINPFLVGEDGAKFSAGMLCTEISRFINPTKNIEFIAGLAGLADRIDNPKVMEQYFEIAEKNNYSKELLQDIAKVVDFVSAKVRFMEAREYIEVLFGHPHEKQKKLVELMAPYIRNLEKKGISIAQSAATTEEISGVTLQLLFIEETFSRGVYPKPGMCTGLIHDAIQKEKSLDKVVTIGVLSDAMTMRATDGSNFSVHELIGFLNEKLPEAFTNGGGHKNAGAIRFVPMKQKEVLQLVKEFIKSRN